MAYSTLTQLFGEELYEYKAAVVVVLAKAWEEYNGEEQLLLQKILTSVKIDIHSVHLLCLPSLSLASLKLFSPQRVLIFGSRTEEEIELYQQTPAQGFIVMKADDLTLLDESRKKNLWTALRLMFSV